jgi:hypothetical protein
MRVDTAYSPNSTQRRLNMISSMRDYVRTGDGDCFTTYCQTTLAGPQGDLIVDVLEELQCELGMPNNAMWDDFEAQYVNAKETA